MNNPVSSLPETAVAVQTTSSAPPAASSLEAASPEKPRSRFSARQVAKSAAQRLKSTLRERQAPKDRLEIVPPPAEPSAADNPSDEEDAVSIDIFETRPEVPSRPNSFLIDEDMADAVAAEEAAPAPAAASGSGMRGPLAGVRVLDLSRLYPGPLATMMMAEMGADVIKVEDMISPDSMRSYPPFLGETSAGYLAVNRSKRSLAIKFNEERGQEIFFRLVKTADIVIEQFRPGVLEHIGLGYQEAIKTNPRIIYISLTGYGQNGPYAKKAGHDVNYMGYAGMIASNASEKGGAVLPGAQIADVAGGAYMAIIAALSALWARETTGVGQKVDVSMLDALLPMLSLQMAQYWATSLYLPPWQMPLSGGLAIYGIYKCKDGKYVSLGALEPKFWKKFCQIVDKPGWEDRYYAHGEANEKLKIEMTRMFKSRTRDEWIDLVGVADICLSPVLDIPEMEDDPHIRARQMIVEHEHPQFGAIKGIGLPLKFSHTHSLPPRPAPALGEHTLQLLEELGFTEKDVADMRRKRAIFTGKP